jgi:CsoR family transcriptional regulator, copper-sensing transcriptional repressor
MEIKPESRFRERSHEATALLQHPLPPDGIHLANHKRKDVANRVARIHGHVHAVKEMLDDGRPYPEIVHQIVAVRSALDSAIQVIVEDLLEDCMGKVAAKEPATEDLEQLQQVMAEIG